LPGVGLITAVGLVPTLLLELKQTIGVGLVSTVGQIPVAMGADQPGLGAISASGLIPALLTERLIAPSVGAVGIAGLVPAALTDGALGPSAGLATLGGLAPSLFTELLVTPDVGLALLEGRQPVVDTGGVVVEATALPGVGLVMLGGLEPTLTVEYDKPRGHVTVKKRRRGRAQPVYEESRGAIAVAKLPPELTPTPVAYWDPPADAIAGIDTAALASVESSLRNLEASQARIARRRREEEEIIALWLRAA
jgi:hypothetical protein